MSTILRVAGEFAAIAFVVLLVVALAGVVAGSILGPVHLHDAEAEVEEAPATRVKDNTVRPGKGGPDGREVTS